MNILTRSFVVAVLCLLSSTIQAQTITKVVFDVNDSTDGYYLSIEPQSKEIKGTLILMTSFLPPENFLTETKLHTVAYANDVLTVVVSMKQKLYADDFAIDRINKVVKDIVTRYSADTSRFAFGGYDEAGNIALRYAELTYEDPSKYLVQPKAVFGIDTSVDLFGFWRGSENQIKKNYWPGAVGDAHYYIDLMTKENGTIYNNAAQYEKLSPFNRSKETTGNEQYLKKLPVRLYYDTDIEWQLKNRRNSFYDTKMPDASDLINQLLLLGNDRAEFISSKQPGVRSNGIRNPNSLSIVDEVECIQWIKRSLDIFDANTWIPPYNLESPSGWDVERFSLPPDFAPTITYKGIEDIRFTPGWGEIKSDEHWSYSFLWWLEGKPMVDAETLRLNLKAYYTGLVGRNIISRKIPENKIVSTIPVIKKIKTASNDLETYMGTISMLDYHTQEPIVLNCLVHVKESTVNNHTVIFFEISPKPLGHPIWKKMNDIGDHFKVHEVAKK